MWQYAKNDADANAEAGEPERQDKACGAGSDDQDFGINHRSALSSRPMSGETQESSCLQRRSEQRRRR
jgi:hypothetical protein